MKKNKKWRPQKELVAEWTEWFRKHEPICQVQELWDASQNPKRASHYINRFWNKHREYFRSKDVSKKNCEKAFTNVIGELRIYSYKKKDDILLEEVHFNLGKVLAELSSEEIILPLDETEIDQDGNEKQVYRGPIESPGEIENGLINQIEPDLRKMREEGKSLRQMEEETGISKSTIHRRLKELNENS